MMKSQRISRNPSDLKVSNMREVLKLIQAEHPLSRAQLARRTGMSKPTTSLAVQALLERNLVTEVSKQAAGIGRRGQMLSPNTTTARLMAIVVDVKECRVMCGDLLGKNHEKAYSFSTPGTLKGFLGELSKGMRAALGRNSAPLLGCGICMPGMSNDESGDIYKCPNLHYLDGVNIL